MLNIILLTILISKNPFIFFPNPSLLSSIALNKMNMLADSSIPIRLISKNESKYYFNAHVIYTCRVTKRVLCAFIGKNKLNCQEKIKVQ